jgi:predicted transposase/invertase (TIGR01784 family)
MSREDAKAQLLYARDEGIEQGIKQGFAQGRNEESIRVAHVALLEGIPIDAIARITGLDTETIRKLEEN